MVIDLATNSSGKPDGNQGFYWFFIQLFEVYIFYNFLFGDEDDEGEDEEETNADVDEGFIFMTFFIFWQGYY